MSEKRLAGAGRFVWHEFVTRDVEKATEYYRLLFGWEFNDIARGGRDLYRSFATGGRECGGMVPLAQEAGSASHWIPYITVDDVDEMLPNLQLLGGSRLSGPAELPGFGRCAIARDPGGAHVALLSGGNPDEELPQGLPAPGNIVWNDLLSRNPIEAGKFYCGVFGWQLFTMDLGAQGTYYLLRRGEINEAGIILKPAEAEGGSAWLPYVAVSDLNTSCVEAAHHGGAIHLPPADLHGAGRFAVIGDPTGGLVALFQPGAQVP